MKLMENALCRRRYKIEIKARRVAKRNKATIFIFCIVAIAAFMLSR